MKLSQDISPIVPRCGGYPHRLIRTCVLLLMVGTHLALARSAGETLSLTIVSPDTVIRESNLVLLVTMTNRTTQPMTVIKSNPGCDFSAEVHDADGKSVPLTNAGAELSRCGNRLMPGRWIRVTLKPGESTDETYPIDLYYGLTRPGAYTVQLSREFPSQPNHVVRSNEVLLKLAE